MRRFHVVILTLVLLMGANMETWAQTIKRTISRQGQAMEYTIKGVTVTKEETLYTGNDPEKGNYMQNYNATVASGKTITVECKKLKGKKIPIILIEFQYYDSPRMSPSLLANESMRKDSVKAKSSVVPKKKYGEVTISYLGDSGDWIVVTCFLDIDGKPAPKVVSTPPSVRQPEEPKNCHQKDSHIRFNDLYGQVVYRCNDEDDDAYEYADFDVVLYENDRIKTYDDSGAILGLWDMSTYVMKPETTLIIVPDKGEENKLKMIIGTMIANIKKMAAGKSLEVEMSQCVCGINGTIVAFEEKGGKSNVYLFAGAVDVKSKKTNKKYALQAGETSSVGSDGNIVVKNFDIEKTAKKMGISMNDIRNHYSNTGNKGLIFTVDKLNYKILSANTVEVTGELRGIYSGHVKIPSTVKYGGVTYQVVGIGKQAFANQKNMTSIEIPASVRTIANDAFKGCPKLKIQRDTAPSTTQPASNSQQPQKSVTISAPGKYSFTLPTNGNSK